MLPTIGGCCWWLPIERIGNRGCCVNYRCIFMTNMKLSYEKQITELHQQLDTNEEKYAHLVNQLNRSYDQKTEKLNNDVTSLSTQVSELTNKLDTYAKDSFELFRKYWFIAKARMIPV